MIRMLLPLNSLLLDCRALHMECADPRQTVAPGQQACLPLKKQTYMVKAVRSRTMPKYPSGNDQNSRAKHKIGR